MFKAPANRTYHKSTKRKQIDPMQALERYKQSSGRKFPTCSEILEVVRSLGYQRPSPPRSSSHPTDDVVACAQAALDQIDRSLQSLD
jgi:hypothetical protein